jgi:hypothetical protein
MGKKLILVCAPDIPCTEVPCLKAHIKESLVDPDYKLVTNYDVTWQIVDVQPGDIVSIVAPNIPPAETVAVREKIDKLDDDPLIVLNYEAYVTVVPGDDISSVRDVYREQHINYLQKQAEKLGCELTPKKK